MTPKNLTDATTALFKILEPLSTDERMRVVKSALILLGEESESLTAKVEGQKSKLGEIGNESDYFKKKAPNTKQEELAVAARYRELKENAISSKRADLELVFQNARVNFDGKRFKDNINNAIKGAGFFNTGGNKKEGYTLSFYGQSYVDALPDRDAIKSLQKPRISKPKKTRKANAGNPKN